MTIETISPPLDPVGRRPPAPSRFQTGALQRPAAETAPLFRDYRHEVEDQAPQALVVHRIGLAHDADVVVRDQRHVDVADLELPRQIGLRILGHVDYLPAGVLIPLGLGSRRETGALHRDHGASVVGLHSLAAGDLQDEGPELGTIGVGERNVGGEGALIEGVLSVSYTHLTLP